MRLAILTLGLLAGCGDLNQVSRVHDADAGVTCWMINANGISCLRDAR